MKFLPKLFLGFTLGWGLGFLGAALVAARIHPPAADRQLAVLAEIIHPPQGGR
jgi:hypothetical protein